jgi:hypothetical protein
MWRVNPIQLLGNRAREVPQICAYWTAKLVIGSDARLKMHPQFCIAEDADNEKIHFNTSQCVFESLAIVV